MSKVKLILIVVTMLATLTAEAGKKHKRKKVYTKCINGTCSAYK
jgi:hypothetical protein